MPTKNKINGPAPVDYRGCHVAKGQVYDSSLAASPFDAYMAKWEARLLTQSVRRLYPNGIPRYLDFACGTGRITQTVAPLARESVGVDISSSMLEMARAKCPETKFVQADLTQEKLDVGTFDLITSFRFFGNAQDELRVAALRAIVDMLRPNGHLVINNHRNPMSIAALLHSATGGSFGMDLHYFKLKRLLVEHGLKLVEVRPIGFWLFRSRMQASEDLANARSRMERMFGWRMFAPFAPDAFLVAQKASTG
jgi:SAM-dependent methyltransferase